MDSSYFVHVFKTYCDKKSGYLKSNNLEKCMRYAGFMPRPDEIEDMIEDASENISLNSFLYICHRFGNYTDHLNEIITAFSIFDKEMGGVLPKDVVINILKNKKKPLKDEEINSLLSQIDSPDDFIDYVELTEKMLNQ